MITFIINMKNNKYKLYTDSSYNKNNSRIGCIGGYIENSQGKMIDSWSELLVDGHFGEHELRSTLLGVKKLIQHGIQDVECFTDNQTNSIILSSDLSKNKHTFRSANLKEIEPLLKNFKAISFTYIPREENTKADYYSRKAYDSITPEQLQMIQKKLKNNMKSKWASMGKNDVNILKTKINEVNEKILVDILDGKDPVIMTSMFIPKSSVSNKELDYFLKINKYIGSNLDANSLQVIDHHNMNVYGYDLDPKEMKRIEIFLNQKHSQYLSNFDLILIKETVPSELLHPIAVEKIANYIADNSQDIQISSKSKGILEMITPRPGNQLMEVYKSASERHFAFKLLDDEQEHHICLLPHKKIAQFIADLSDFMIPRHENLFSNENLSDEMKQLFQEEPMNKLLIFKKTLEHFNKFQQLPDQPMIKNFSIPLKLDLESTSFQTIKDKLLGDIMTLEIQEMRKESTNNLKERIKDKVESLQKEFGFTNQRPRP